MGSLFTPDSLRFLRSESGQQTLRALETADLSDANTLKLLTGLRRQHPRDNAAAALETARLRLRARDKFPANIASRLFLTREALEQASHWAIGHYVHRHLLRRSENVADLGCGIGADTLWLAQGNRVLAIDRDPLRLAMAQANLVGYAACFVQADLTEPLPFSGVPAAFFDPARRADDHRIFSVRDYMPPLDVVRGWRFERLLVKLSPGVDLAELAPYHNDQSRVYFVSVNGELKEALLHIDPINRQQGPGHSRHAVVITAESASGAAEPDFVLAAETPLDALPVREPRGYLYEPDPAIIRAGLLPELAERLALEMHQLDSTIAYLSAESLVSSRLARAWIIDDWMPFNLKKLRAYLRERGVGRVTVKKRGSPITPEELIARLKLPSGDQERVVVLTRVQGQPAILICRTL